MEHISRNEGAKDNVEKLMFHLTELYKLKIDNVYVLDYNDYEKALKDKIKEILETNT